MEWSKMDRPSRAGQIALPVACIVIAAGASALLFSGSSGKKLSGIVQGKILRIATGDIGITENPPGSNRGPQIDQWLKDVGQVPGQEWCAAWASSVLRRAGFDKIAGTAGALALGEQFKAAGRFSIPKTYMKGGGPIPSASVAVWNHGNGKGHVGIVVKDSGDTFETIEGNSDLGNVRRRTDRRKDDPQLVGFGMTDTMESEFPSNVRTKFSRPIIIGDSLAGGLSGPLKSKMGAKSSYKNGSTIDFWAKGAMLPSALSLYRPDLVLVSLGTNDMQTPNPEYKRDLVRGILNQIQNAGATAVWILPPTMPFPDKGTLRVLSDELSASNVQAIHSETFDLSRGPDKIHPTVTGFSKWASKIAESISDKTVTTVSAPEWSPATMAILGEPNGTVISVRGVSPDNVNLLLSAAKDIQTPVDSLATVLSFESAGLKPWIINGVKADKDGHPIPGPYMGRYLLTDENAKRVSEGKRPFFAVGLNQLTLGANLPGFDTNEKLLAASTWGAAEQLKKIVIPFYKRIGNLSNVSPGKLYMLNFLPKFANSPPNTVIGDKNSPDGLTRAIYFQNIGFDHDGKGTITVSDVYRALQGVLSASHGIRLAGNSNKESATSCNIAPCRSVQNQACGKPIKTGSYAPHFQDIPEKSIVKPEWTIVPWRGLKVIVGKDTLRANLNGGPVRVPVSWEDAKLLFKRFNYAPMVEDLSDAIYQAAHWHPDPRPQASVDDKTETVSKYNRAVDKQIPACYNGIIADTGKDLVAHNRVLLGKGGLAMYGWRRPSEHDKPIQGTNPMLPPVHASTYRDYSHTFRPIQRFALGPHGPVDLLDYYQKELGIHPETWEPSDTHAHVCANCGNMWQHTEASFGNVLNHTCDKCGSEQWRKA